VNYSPIHIKISKTYPDVLEEPEKYLGPNYETILNFWWFVDGLNCEQARILGTAYRETIYEIRSQSYKHINEHVETKEYQFADDIWNNVIGACEDKDFSLYDEFEFLMGWITLELMVMHELLDKGLPLLFVQMLKDLWQSPNCPPNHP
jgi:hypothetical protein